MPIYPFACDGCGAEFEVMRRPAAMREPAPCPACGGPTRRVFTGVAVTGQASEPASGKPAGGWSHGGHSHGAGASAHTH